MEIININRLGEPNSGTVKLDANECVLIENALYRMREITSGDRREEYQDLQKRFKVFTHIVSHGWVHRDDLN